MYHKYMYTSICQENFCIHVESDLFHAMQLRPLPIVLIQPTPKRPILLQFIYIIF